MAAAHALLRRVLQALDENMAVPPRLNRWTIGLLIPGGRAARKCMNQDRQEEQEEFVIANRLKSMIKLSGRRFAPWSSW
jgi:hypothetical protein